jgi:hypothetical protein
MAGSGVFVIWCVGKVQHLQANATMPEVTPFQGRMQHIDLIIFYNFISRRTVAKLIVYPPSHVPIRVAARD